jgi:hypothetical protein
MFVAGQYRDFPATVENAKQSPGNNIASVFFTDIRCMIISGISYQTSVENAQQSPGNNIGVFYRCSLQSIHPNPPSYSIPTSVERAKHSPSGCSGACDGARRSATE